ncbi:site-specific DNA-methyltransferase (adenine-specific) [Pseudonocardia thermophila]|uniref:Methyltransferase n=1 Tax=Pseudonocardia thermophila TaxID=1848 RepID=A0A1M7AXN4_PSETH|nr:DNA methyltransferase [Pseudonocardia thermophila]SHL47528.1 site-specific DNA-methyltransferase (adenine-specific) [Pseudonocardia thermophila]
MTNPNNLQVTYYPTADLRLYHRNPRVGNTSRIAESLTVNGQYKPVVVNRGTHTGRPNEVLAGNHTLKAARDLGWETLAAVTVDVDDDQAARIVAADNRTSDLGSYDNRLLLELLTDLPNLDGTGYDPGDLDALEALLDADVEAQDEVPLNDPDDSPDTPAEPYCKTGDLWVLGSHRLAVGDSTDPGVWDLLLNGDKADMVWTDPPYGVSYVGKTADALTIENDSLDADSLRDFLRAALGLASTHTRPGGCWYVASPPGELSLVFGGVLVELEVLRQTLIWVKDQFVMGRSDYHYRHELVFYGWVPGAAHHAVLDRTQDTVHEYPRPKRSKEHPTMKPVALIARHITNSTDRNQLVVDPFGGSGSTLIAAHDAGRRAAVIEIDPKYADVICRRYQEHTGQLPTRDGQPHDFTEAAE